jgi:hypothetical protein
LSAEGSLFISTESAAGPSAPDITPIHRSASAASFGDELYKNDIASSEASVATASRPFTPYASLNAQLSSKRLANVVTTTSSSKKPALTLDNYPCIIPHPKRKGQWIELRCYICQGNAREDGLFLKGLKGLKRHMQLSHKPHFADLPLKQQFSLEASIVRTFTRQDLEDMLGGKIERVQMITCAKEIGTGEEPEVKIEEHGSNRLILGDQPFDFLNDWPTVVLREDMVWVEIRCFSVSAQPIIFTTTKKYRVREVFYLSKFIYRCSVSSDNWDSLHLKTTRTLGSIELGTPSEV